MEPKQIKSSGISFPSRIERPQRYEWEEISNSPPPSTQNILQLFDTNTLARDHPRKYQLLVAQEDGAEQTLKTSTDKKPRSSSTQFTTSPLEALKKNNSLVDLKTFNQQNALEGEKVNVHEALSDADVGISNSSRQTESKNLDSTNLSAIAQKYVGLTQPIDPQDRRFSLGIPQLQTETGHQQDRRFSMDDMMTMKQNFTEISNDTSLSSASSPPVQKVDTKCEPNDLVPVSVQPNPRRFLGIGGFFKPLPETMLIPKDAAKSGNLSNEIQKLGITAAGQDQRKSEASVDAVDCKKKAPTRAEMNIWAPSGM